LLQFPPESTVLERCEEAIEFAERNLMGNLVRLNSRHASGERVCTVLLNVRNRKGLEFVPADVDECAADALSLEVPIVTVKHRE